MFLKKSLFFNNRFLLKNLILIEFSNKLQIEVLIDKPNLKTERILFHFLKELIILKKLTNFILLFLEFKLKEIIFFFHFDFLNFKILNGKLDNVFFLFL
jgi:hypothetical protein